MLKKSLIGLICFASAAMITIPCFAIVSEHSLYRRANAYLEEGKTELAFMTFRETLYRYPKSLYLDDAMYNIIRYHMDTRNYFEASRILKQHLRKFPDSKHRTQIVDYARMIRTKELIKKAEQSLRLNNYELTLYYYDEVLKLDPENEAAKKQIANVDRILMYGDYRRIQLQNEKKRIEAESRSIAREMAELERHKLEIEQLKQQAEEMDKKTRQKYQKLLDESYKQRQLLEERIEKLMTDLANWKRLAKKYEAKMLLEPNITGLKLITETDDLPRVIFEGPTTRGLADNEHQPEELLKTNSPLVVLVSEMRDEDNNIVTAEFVVSVDLKQQWPKNCLLKLRVDFFNLLSDNTPTRIARPKIIYYSESDMDEIDKENLSYSKKIMMSVGDKQYQKFEVIACFVQQ